MVDGMEPFEFSEPASESDAASPRAREDPREGSTMNPATCARHPERERSRSSAKSASTSGNADAGMRMIVGDVTRVCISTRVSNLRNGAVTSSPVVEHPTDPVAFRSMTQGTFVAAGYALDARSFVESTSFGAHAWTNAGGAARDARPGAHTTRNADNARAARDEDHATRVREAIAVAPRATAAWKGMNERGERGD